MSRKRQSTDDRTDKWQTHPFQRREDWRSQMVKDALGTIHTVMVLDEDRLRARG